MVNLLCTLISYIPVHDINGQLYLALNFNCYNQKSSSLPGVKFHQDFWQFSFLKINSVIPSSSIVPGGERPWNHQHHHQFLTEAWVWTYDLHYLQSFVTSSALLNLSQCLITSSFMLYVHYCLCMPLYLSPLSLACSAFYRICPLEGILSTCKDYWVFTKQLCLVELFGHLKTALCHHFSFF